MLKKFFTNKKGEVAVAQWPNLPIILWAVFSLVAFIAEGEMKNNFSLLASMALFTWAYLEITSDASPFRRALGLIVMMVIIYNLFR